jgi:transposase
MGWVLRLRKVLEGLDYTLLMRRYDILGRKALHPRMMLGLIVYGMMMQQWSLRALQALAVRDVGAWWICGGKQPDHSTIGKFIQSHAEVLSEEFFVALTGYLVKRLKVQPGVVAGDGTVIEAAASRYRALKAEAAQLLAVQAETAARAQPQDCTLQAQAVRAAEVAEVARQRQAERVRCGKDPAAVRVVATEPSAVVQPTKAGICRPSYKPSSLVHESGLIVGQAVHGSSERAAVEPMLDQHRAIVDGEPARLLLDAGYFGIAVFEQAVNRGIDVLCPSGAARGNEDWDKQGPKGKFSKRQFHYDASRDEYRCPAGELLRPRPGARDHHGRAFWQYSTKACRGCELRARCTTARGGRTIKRYDGEQYTDAMVEVMRQPGARRAYRRRGPLAETPFAEFGERQGLRRFHRRGDEGVRVEWALHCMAFNLNRAVNRFASVVFMALWRRNGGGWHCVGVMWLFPCRLH